LRKPIGASWPHEDKELFNFKQQQRLAGHEILTKDLVNALKTYEDQFVSSTLRMVQYCVFNMATAITKLRSGGVWTIERSREEGEVRSNFEDKFLNDLEAYGRRVSQWQMENIQKVLSWCDRICELAEKHGIYH